MLDILMAVAATGAAAFGLHRLAGRTAERAFRKPVQEVESLKPGIVVAYHPEVREIGMRVLESGGNAMDAFVAAVAAENVMAEGASTLTGPLGVLVYTASDNRVRYLDADLNDPMDPSASWDPKSAPGRSALVPGAPAALELIANELGTRPLLQLLRPSIELAENGFRVNALMAETIRRRRKLLRKSDFGSRTYLRDGKPLEAGATIRLPAVAQFLMNFGSQGASYVYTGQWAREFLAYIRDRGGLLTEEDLVKYRVVWRQPYRTTFRDYEIFSNSGRSFGGLFPLLALKILEHSDMPEVPHYTQHPGSLETMLRIAHKVWAEEWLFDFRALDDIDAVASRLTSEYAAGIWERVRKELEPDPHSRSNGTHSYHLMAADPHGNIVTGTTTIYSDAWGEGMFVQGIPVAPAGMMTFLCTQPGERRLSPLSMQMVFRDGRPVFCSGTISDSLLEAAFQVLTNYLVHGLPVAQVASMPRFGTYPDERRNYLDPRVPSGIVKQLERKGFRFRRRGVVDTGLGAVIAIENSKVAGSLLPLPYLERPFVVPPAR
jgi:gamma-glutamyltranspeptidase/glutathione hydrolase